MQRDSSFQKIQTESIFARFKFDYKQIRNKKIENLRKLSVFLYKTPIA